MPKPKVGGYIHKQLLTNLDQDNRIIIEAVSNMAHSGGLNSQASRYLLKIANAAARQQAAISDLRDIASYSENGNG